MPVTYTAAADPQPPGEDSVDQTSIAIHLDDRAAEHSQRSATCRSSFFAQLAQSTTVRYLVVLVAVALVIFLLERLLGTEASQELRRALLESVKETIQQALRGSSPRPTLPPS